MHSRRLLVGLFLLFSVAAVVGYGGVGVLRSRQLKSGLNQAKREMAAGRQGTARHRLIELGQLGGGDGEVEYLLGVCELSQGRRSAALAAWERVPPSSPWAVEAAVQRGMALLEAGQFGRAEEILTAARAGARGADALPLLHALSVLYQIEGRQDDLRESIIESWPYTDTPTLLVQKLSWLDSAPLEVGTLYKTLGIGPSDDDRVWLGRAYLAARTGNLDSATSLLTACLKRRPDDPVVWRAFLEVAQTAGDVMGVWQALEHLPAAELGAVNVARIRAWLAARIGAGAGDAERAALRELVERDPGDTAALDRLTALAALAGEDHEAAGLRLKRAKVAAAWLRYRELLAGEATASGHAERANLAEFLGRPVEARGWSLLRDGRAGSPGSGRPPLDPQRAVGRVHAAGNPAGQTVAAMCADLRPGAQPSRRPAVAAASPTTPRFDDAALAAGLRFIQDNADSPLKRLPETTSGGVALFDYDGDGWLDVYAVQGGALPPVLNEPCGDHLFRNRGDGTFEDVTGPSGVAKMPGGYGHGVAVGDYDNDGDPDLFITRWQAYALWRNRGDGTFEDVTAQAGLGGNRDWPTSAAWADLDGDGDLDLYVCHYLVYDLEHPRSCPDRRKGFNQYCSPRYFEALADHVFRNDGGRFVDVTRAAGFVDPGGRGLGVVAANLDDDDRIDLYVANDLSANYLFHNLGDFRFEEIAQTAGAATNGTGAYQAGMGIACGDFDGDGRPDLAVTNFFGESTTFFRNLGPGLFCDETAAIGLAAPTRSLLGFGITWLDANNDGRLDLISANGHVEDQRPAFPWKMPTQLLLGGPDGRLHAPPGAGGEVFRQLHLGRGLAGGDLDNDGRVDVLVQSQNEPLAFLHNQTQGGGHWVTLHLEGVQSNRDAVGARASVLAGGRWQVVQRIGGGSFQSAADPRLHFGLGDATAIDRLEVRWPSGRLDRYIGLRVDRGYKVREGSPEVEPLRGFKHSSG
jgi:tetratricopeptide (TPR) repeat protein